MTATATHLAIANESPVVLRASGLRKSFGGQLVLDGVDALLRRGEVVLLEGKNGSGKTTLLNILTGNLVADAGTIRYSANSHAAEYRFPRSWMQKLSVFNRFAPDTIARLGFGRTWQDVRLFRSLSLHDNIAVGQQEQRGENPLFALLGLPRKPVRSNSRGYDSKPSIVNASANSLRYDDQSPDKMLEKLGLAGREQSSGDMISLGQSKRVAIARAIAAGGKVLFLDEPLAGLDRNGIEDVVNVLSNLVADHQMTIVIIEHVFNHAFLRNLVTTRWNLDSGQVTNYSPMKAEPAQVDRRPQWLEFLSKNTERIATEELPRGATLTRFGPVNTREPKPILKIKDLVIRRGKRTVIGLDDHGHESGLNLTLYEGEVSVLQAPNGWGKSTLVETLSGFLTAASGNFSFEGDRRLSVQDQMVVVPAKNRVFHGLTLRENTRLFRSSELLNHAGLDTSRQCSSLSGGELALFAIGVNSSAKIAVLDEPFLGMSSNAVRDSIINSKIFRSESLLILEPSKWNF